MTESSYWKDRSVMVTGCTGLLGSWLAARLTSEGAAVVGLIRDAVPDSNLRRSGTLDRINVVTGSVTDYDVVLRALNEYEVDTCFHLAAQTIVTIANRSPISTFESNIAGTWTVLEACRHTPTLRAVVVASSDKAYGEQEQLPYTEEAPLAGTHPYDVSKSCSDLIAQAYHTTYRLPVGISRCGNLYGGGDLNFNRLIPGTVRSILNDEAPVIRSDGSPLRDYVYVEDAVECYLLLARALDRDEIRGQAFNFGPERPLSVADLVSLLIQLSGRSHLQPKVLSSGKLSGEILHQYLSHRKAERMLGWRPRWTLEDGLRETLKWYEAFFRTRPGTRAN